MTLTPEDRAERYLRQNPDATPAELAGALEVPPDRARSLLEECPKPSAKSEAVGTPPESWHELDYAETVGPAYPPALAEYGQWMARPPGEKYPYAPWTDPDAPAECSRCGTTCDECEHHAGYKWGYEPNYRDLEAAKRGALDADVGGLVFIQLETDPFVFVDGDDVRCPDTGKVHPEFLDLLDRLGLTFADVSTSGAGVHAYYRGGLPADETVADWQLDSEPWGSNDDLPAVEIYSGKHVCLTTGDRVAGTPDEVRPWDTEAAHALVEQHDAQSEDEYTSLDAYDSAVRSQGEQAASDTGGSGGGSGGGTTPVDAVDHLNAQDVAERTIVADWTSGASTSEGEKAFLPIWGSASDSGTANIVNRDWWVDTGDHGGSGGPIEMAAIDLGLLDERHAEPGAVTGEDWWQAYEHLQDLGFDLPDRGGQTEHSDYYDAPLGDLVDGDPWSDPDAMLEACLQARARGVVEEEADPPTLALIPVARELLDETEVSGGVRGELIDVYHAELSVADMEGGSLTL